MIGFGCVVSDQEQLRRHALPGIRSVWEEGDEIEVRRGQSCILTAYNDIVDTFAGRDDLEAVVLLHQDVEISDPGFRSKLREELSDPEVGVIGAIGGVGVRSIAWWERSVSIGSVGWDWLGGEEHRRTHFEDHEFWLTANGRSGTVDAVDGLMLILTPAAIERIRFDESLGPGFHAYDVDICFQARAAGLKVRVASLDVIHHHSIRTMTDRAGWTEAHVRFSRKWGL